LRRRRCTHEMNDKITRRKKVIEISTTQEKKK
jgi:hypothetical protein